MAIVVTCTCGKQLKVKDELAGRRGKCVACGQALLIPTLPRSPDKDVHPPPAPRACPTCHKPLRPEAVICVNCGFNLRTGKKLAPAKPPMSVAPTGQSDQLLDEASARRLPIALIAGGVCLTVVAAALLLFFWNPWAGKPAAIAESYGESQSGTSTGASLAALGTQPTNGTANQGKAPSSAVPFEEALRAGAIAWQPVKNVQLTTRTAGGRKTESFEFVTKLKYDGMGKASPDTTGQKSYTWPDQEASFGPEAVIRLTQDANVREGALRAGDEWTWTGQQWTAKPNNRPGEKAGDDKKQIANGPQKQEKKPFITQAIFDKILAEKMTEAQITEILGAGRASGSTSIPPGMTEKVWEDSKQNSITVQFQDGKAQGGKSTIYTNR